MKRFGFTSNPSALPTTEEYQIMGRNIEERAKTSKFFSFMKVKINEEKSHIFQGKRERTKKKKRNGEKKWKKYRRKSKNK